MIALFIICVIAAGGMLVDTIAEKYGVRKGRAEIIYLYMVIGALLAFADVTVLK